MGTEAAGLPEKDYRRRGGGTGRRARRARMRHVPAPARAQQVPGGASTLGITHHLKDHGRMDPRTAGMEEADMARRGFGTERHNAPGSAVGKDSERPYTKHSNIPFAGNSNQATEV